jgi:hypothetical protein
MGASYQAITPYQIVVAWLSMRLISFGADAAVACLRVDRGRATNVRSWVKELFQPVAFGAAGRQKIRLPAGSKLSENESFAPHFECSTFDRWKIESLIQAMIKKGRPIKLYDLSTGFFNAAQQGNFSSTTFARNALGKSIICPVICPVMVVSIPRESTEKLDRPNDRAR